MQNLNYVIDILIVYLAAMASAILFKKMKQATIVGYLVAGTLIGPFALNLISGVHEVEFLAEIGVVFFLFLVGLEFPMDRMGEMGRKIFGVGGFQVLLTSTAFFFLFSALGFSTPTALLLGMILSLSSTAIVLKVLVEKAELRSLYGKTTLSVLLFQDLMIVPIMIFIPILSGSEGEFTGLLLAKALGKAALVIVLIFLAARYFFKPIVAFIARQRSSELFIISVLFLCLGTAILTHVAGFSLILGAFTAGLVLSDTEFKHQITADLMPFRDSLLPLFFISVGMLLDLTHILDNLSQVMILFIEILLIKLLVIQVVLAAMRYPFRQIITVGLALAQVGEFAFILLLEGKGHGLVAADLYQTILSTIVLSMLAAPFLMDRSQQWAFALASRPRISRLFAPLPTESVEETAKELENHVIVCGYGVAGKNIVRSLKTFDIPYLVLDLNWSNVEKGMKAGDPIAFGDAGREEILRAAGIAEARALVLSIDEHGATAEIVKMARRLAPKTFILVRTRFVGTLQTLEKAGADLVVPEEFESSLKIVSELLRKFEFGTGEIEMLIKDIRIDHYALFKRSQEEEGEKFRSEER